MDATMSSNCGSKRIAGITPGGGKPTSVWRHQCGSNSERQRDKWPRSMDEDDPIPALDAIVNLTQLSTLRDVQTATLSTHRWKGSLFGCDARAA